MDTEQNQEFVFTHRDYHSHEGVFFGHDETTGFKGIIAIHSRKRGPALGGMRMSLYPDEPAALSDVLRLSEGMLVINQATEYVVGIKSGDPSRLTAYGTYLRIKACVEFKLGKKELRG